MQSSLMSKYVYVSSKGRLLSSGSTLLCNMLETFSVWTKSISVIISTAASEKDPVSFRNWLVPRSTKFHAVQRVLSSFDSVNDNVQPLQMKATEHNFPLLQFIM